MALTVTITNAAAGAPNSFSLLCQTIRISARRSPIQAPLPNASVIMVDLGQFYRDVTCSGTIDDDGDSSPSPVVPTREQLETAVSAWWASGTAGQNITLVVPGNPSPAGTQSYLGTFQSVEFIRDAGKPFWEFTLVFKVYSSS